MRSLALISNPDSGSAGEGDVERPLREAGWEIERYPISDASAAAEADVERIVVAGGDGSIAPAAAAAVERGVPLAVIATGTANDFAARMGLPGGIAAGAKLAGSGTETRPVDLAAIGGRPFVNAASLGLSPAAADAAEELKDSIGALAYTVGALRAAGSEAPFEVSVASGGEEQFSGPAWQLTVGCTGAFGGGSEIAADADDGRLDWVVIEGGPRARLAKHAVGLRTGNVESQKGVRTGRSATLDVGPGDCEKVNVDGEVAEVSALASGAGVIRFEIASRELDLVIG